MPGLKHPQLEAGRSSSRLPDSLFPAVGGSSINANYKQNRLRRPEGFCCYEFKWVRFLNLREEVEEPALDYLKPEFSD